MTTATKTRRTRKPLFIEAGMVVEMKDGTEHYLAFVNPDAVLYHHPGEHGFEPLASTPIEEFRSNVKRVTSRARHDSRC